MDSWIVWCGEYSKTFELFPKTDQPPESLFAEIKKGTSRLDRADHNNIPHKNTTNSDAINVHIAIRRETAMRFPAGKAGVSKLSG